MASALTDKFRKGAGFFQTTLSGSVSDSDTTLTLASATGLPTDTAMDFVVDRIDQNGELLDPSLREVITGTVSGTTITTDATRRGLDNTTAQAHTAGAVVEVNFTADTWNDTIDGLLVSHEQDGTLKDDVVDTAQIADDAVDTAQIADDAVGTAQIADEAVTEAKIYAPLWWEELGRTTLGSAASSISVSFTAKKYLRVLIGASPSTSTVLYMRVNSDSGANYAYRYQDNGGASTTGVSQNQLRMIGGNDLNWFWEFNILNIAAKEKRFVYTGTDSNTGAGNAPESFIYFGKWANTSVQISSIQISVSTGNFNTTSEMIVLGHD